MEDTLHTLIAIPSKSGSEQAIALYISERMRKLGIEVFEVSGNSIGFIKGRNAQKCLIFNGHIDTVGAGEPGGWHTDPLKPQKIEGKIFGLGASDMKSGVAVLLKLAEHFAANTPECDTYFAFVRGEEVDGIGSQEFLNWFQKRPQHKTYTAIEAIIAEPTSAKEVEVGHRGNRFVQITVTSASGHGSRTQSPDSSILVAAQIISGLKKLNQAWSKEYTSDMLGSPSIAVTGVAAGDFETPNKVPAESLIQLDIRTIPAMHDAVEQLLKDFLASYTSKAEVILREESPPGLTGKESEIRQIFHAAYPSLPQTVMTGSSDLCFFVNQGIPAVIFGPGQKDTIHAANEYVQVGSMEKCFATLKDIAEQYGAK